MDESYFSKNGFYDSPEFDSVIKKNNFTNEDIERAKIKWMSDGSAPGHIKAKYYQQKRLAEEKEKRFGIYLYATVWVFVTLVAGAFSDEPILGILWAFGGLAAGFVLKLIIKYIKDTTRF